MSIKSISIDAMQAKLQEVMTLEDVTLALVPKRAKSVAKIVNEYKLRNALHIFNRFYHFTDVWIGEISRSIPIPAFDSDKLNLDLVANILYNFPPEAPKYHASGKAWENLFKDNLPGIYDLIEKAERISKTLSPNYAYAKTLELYLALPTKIASAFDMVNDICGWQKEFIEDMLVHKLAFRMRGYDNLDSLLGLAVYDKKGNKKKFFITGTNYLKPEHDNGKKALSANDAGGDIEQLRAELRKALLSIDQTHIEYERKLAEQEKTYETQLLALQREAAAKGAEANILSERIADLTSQNEELRSKIRLELEEEKKRIHAYITNLNVTGKLSVENLYAAFKENSLLSDYNAALRELLDNDVGAQLIKSYLNGKYKGSKIIIIGTGDNGNIWKNTLELFAAPHSITIYSGIKNDIPSSKEIRNYDVCIFIRQGANGGLSQHTIKMMGLAKNEAQYETSWKEKNLVIIPISPRPEIHQELMLGLDLLVKYNGSQNGR